MNYAPMREVSSPPPGKVHHHTFPSRCVVVDRQSRLVNIFYCTPTPKCRAIDCNTFLFCRPEISITTHTHSKQETSEALCACKQWIRLLEFCMIYTAQRRSIERGRFKSSTLSGLICFAATDKPVRRGFGVMMKLLFCYYRNLALLLYIFL